MSARVWPLPPPSLTRKPTRRRKIPSFHTGAYGQVWKCLDKDTGRMVAMKRFKEVRALG